LKLWSFYVDLEESIGTVESTKAVYDKIMDLKIANAQVIVNYAAFLEDNQYWEDSFKVRLILSLFFWLILKYACNQVYERGTEVFTFPISFEIWNIYLSKFVKRYVRAFVLTCHLYRLVNTFQGGSKLERARDLFEQALEKCPPQSCKPLFLMYGQLEEDYGLAKRAMSIYERATQVVADENKFEVLHPVTFHIDLR
jgi:pre-mRNA-splicing factor SYF1